MAKPLTASRPDKAERPITRPTEATRRALISAAIVVFSDHGYEAASVRDITGKAKVNQGAITYHFDGKEGLYREVLRTVREALSRQPLLSLETLDAHTPEEALRLFVRQALAPLADTARVKRYLRIFAWEQLKPTTVRERLSRDEPFPTVILCHALVRRFLPNADDTRLAVTAAWLLGQTGTFIRDAEWLALPPFRLTLDGDGVAGLAETLADLCLRGLASVNITVT